MGNAANHPQTLSLEIIDREQWIATNKAYGAMQLALERIRDLRRTYGHFDGHLAASVAAEIAKGALELVEKFEAEADGAKDGGPDLGRDSDKSRELQARGKTAGDISDTQERLCDERRTVIRRDSRERPA